MKTTLTYRYDDWSNTGPSSSFRHQVYIYHTTFRESDGYVYIRWLYKNIGSYTLWRCTTYHDHIVVYFKYIDDAMAFKLRWL